jgi:four helix bundle protein
MVQKGYKELKVYQMSYRLALQIYKISKDFPVEEKYSLTDQIRRSSRSVPVNIATAYRRRNYPKHFASKVTDANEECTETLVWLDLAFDCGYIDEELKVQISNDYDEAGRMLGSMADNPEKFLPKKSQ